MSEPKLYRILQISFISIIIGLLVASAFLFASGSRVRRWCRTASKAIYSGDYATAITYYERYLYERPFDSDTWGDLALAHFHLGRYDACIAAIRQYESTGFSMGGDEQAEAEATQRYRDRLIRYVQCVAAGEDYGEEPPRFFSYYAPSEQSR